MTVKRSKRNPAYDDPCWRLDNAHEYRDIAAETNRYQFYKRALTYFILEAYGIEQGSVYEVTHDELGRGLRSAKFAFIASLGESTEDLFDAPIGRSGRRRLLQNEFLYQSEGDYDVVWVLREGLAVRLDVTPLLAESLGWTEETLMEKLADSMNKLGGIIVEYEKDNELLKKAMFDMMTEVLRKEEGISRLVERVAEVEKTGKPFTLAFVDGDNVKSTNDTYGHEAGDALILHYVKLLKDAGFDPAEHIVRWGGDEFVIICPEDVAPIIAALELSRKSQFVDPKSGTQIRSGISIGTIDVTKERILRGRKIAVEKSAIRPEDTVAILVKWADIAMYVAKKLGKLPGKAGNLHHHEKRFVALEVMDPATNDSVELVVSDLSQEEIPA